ncbi:MAG TPA: uracil phosphoribosyltransferase [Bacteroidales bacterium]|nr:uracil phosphoribosyltransferase [Bacteroidales bacterium]HRZ77239.1 uracil phosphoribosyltransferase [Bacteroidales bacterium]
MVRNLGRQHSILNQFIAELRDEVIQQDSMRFRRNLERISEIFAYEISKEMEYEEKEVSTALGAAHVPMLKEHPVIASILRAGIPMHLGLLNYFDHSENAFISAYRKYKKDGRFTIQIEYLSSPSLEGRTLVLCDPMLATGASMVLTYRNLMEKGRPKHTHLVTILASVEGVEYVRRHLPASEVTLWVGAVDEELTAQAYIVPGLGDAGDLAFGSKDS